MFFYLSKILWVFTAPSNLLVAAVVLVVLLPIGRGRRSKRRMGLAAVLLSASFLPIGSLVLRPLELRFSRPDLSNTDPAGIIVLGGAISPALGAAHGTVHLVEGAERLTAAATLADRFPHIPVIYTGGTNAVVLWEGSEAADAKRLLVELGVAADRILLEDGSRNTAENASNTRDVVHPTPGQHYLLVTSAYHMSRSVGLFRRAGFSVVAYPVDYRTTGDARDFLPLPTAGQGLGTLDFAVREWIGLVAYFVAGKIDTVFPGPTPVAH